MEVPVKPGVAVGADGEQLAAIAGVRRIDVPAEAAQNGLIGRALRLGELPDGERAEEAHAVEFAAVEHHLGEARQVVGGGEQAGVARHAAHVARGGVVHHSAQTAARSWGTRSVGAMRGTSAAGGWNMVSFMPSGRKTFSRA